MYLNAYCAEIKIANSAFRVVIIAHPSEKVNRIGFISSIFSLLDPTFFAPPSSERASFSFFKTHNKIRNAKKSVTVLDNSTKKTYNSVIYYFVRTACPFEGVPYGS